MCCVAALKSLPVHSVNALIIQILKDCLQSLFKVLSLDSLPFDTVLKVISQPVFVSRCVTGTYFSFYGLVLDIAMNCGVLLYCSLNLREFTYMTDYLIILITGKNVAFFDGITNFQTIMSITNSLTISLTPVRLHFVSSVRIPRSVHNFRNLIPSVKLQPLNPGSTSSINLHGF